MPTPEQEAQEGRQKRTILLLTGGAVSLVLPLIGIVYIRMNEAKTARPPDSSVMFDRREKGDSKVNVSQTVTIIAPSAREAAPGGGGSSLDFVKGGANNNYFQEKPAAAAVAPAVPAPAAAAPAPVPEPEPAPKASAKKSGKKEFNRPKLHGVKPLNSFKGASPRPTGGQGMTGAADPQAGKSGDDMAEFLKNVPGGASNPEVQKYLKSQGQ